MASPACFEIADYLNPIEESSPCGQDPRGDSSVDSLYFKLKDARNAARAVERANNKKDSQDIQTPDWDSVADLASELLVSKAKDLEACSYLIEALVRIHGFPGLRDGFKLAKGLVENFWDGLFPLPDEDGLSTKIGPLNALNGVDSEGILLTPVRQIPITDIGTTKAYSLSDWIIVSKMDGLDQETLAKRIERGAPDPSDFHSTIYSTTPEFYLNLFEDILECKQSFLDLSDMVDQKSGEVVFLISSLKALFEEVINAIESFAGDKLERARAQVVSAGDNLSSNDVASGEGRGVVPFTGSASGSVIVKNREDALMQLRVLADFFLRTEPHSPVSYAINQAVRWGKLSLPDLIMELIPDQNSRDYISKLTGVQAGLNNFSGNSSNETDS